VGVTHIEALVMNKESLMRWATPMYNVTASLKWLSAQFLYNYTISAVLNQPLPISPYPIQDHGKSQGK